MPYHNSGLNYALNRNTVFQKSDFLHRSHPTEIVLNDLILLRSGKEQAKDEQGKD